VRRIGVLMTRNVEDPQLQARLAAFVQGLQQLGWTDGRNMRIDIRWGGGNAETMRRETAELVKQAGELGRSVQAATANQFVANLMPVVHATHRPGMLAKRLGGLARTDLVWSYSVNRIAKTRGASW
jgi:hypothetical protein